MNLYLIALIAILLAIISLAKKNLIILSFILPLTLQFVISPFLAYSAELISEEQFSIGLDLVYKFMLSFSITLFIMHVFVKNLSFSLPLLPSYTCIYLTLISKRIFLLGSALKLLSGTVTHSSVATLPWSFPVLTGIADKLFFFALITIVYVIVIKGFTVSKSQLCLFLAIIFISVIGGSRSSLIIPLSFFIILRMSLIRSPLHAIFASIAASLSIVLVVGLIGILRTSKLNFYTIYEVSIQRLNDLIWPVKLVSLLQNGSLSYQPHFFFLDLLAFLPSAFTSPFLGYSLFSADTLFMEEIGLGNSTMSVPMTIFGESYLVGGHLGPLGYGVIFAIFLTLLSYCLNSFPFLPKLIVFLLLYKYILVLPLGTFADLVSLLSKDLIFAIFLYLFLKQITFRSIFRCIESCRL